MSDLWLIEFFALFSANDGERKNSGRSVDSLPYGKSSPPTAAKTCRVDEPSQPTEAASTNYKEETTNGEATNLPPLGRESCLKLGVTQSG